VLTNVTHLALLGALLELDAELSQAVALLLNVIDADGDMSEAASGLLVAAAVLEIFLLLVAMVPAELEYSSASCGAIRRKKNAGKWSSACAPSV
jgi:hypothetical protein